LLAAIPSVVYGLWGIFVVIPFVRPPANWLHSHLGWIPFFLDQMNYTCDIDLFREWARVACWGAFEAPTTRKYNGC